tara:strand:- start:3149 stop:4915 length:1767 start_codon:yes stop_codon:yes gene_type:complete
MLCIAACLSACANTTAPAAPQASDAAAPVEEIEILKITVGTATQLTTNSYQNTSALSVSRTGAVAAHYPKPPREVKKYRISNDAGKTWGAELDAPTNWSGAMSVGLRDGGVLKLSTETIPVDGEPGWFDMDVFKGTDDFSSWEVWTSQIHVPDHAPGFDVTYPSTAKGPIIELPGGELLMPMYGQFKGDTQHRSYLVRSTDQGHTWLYYATIDYTPDDPNPELPGHYVGACESSVVLLPNGQLLAMMRKQLAHFPGEYKPLYQCRSDDLGKTWTTPTPTNPHLMCISPTLQVLDNGVVACQYGRPGCHVAFSLDNGHTWQDNVTLTDLPERPSLVDQATMAGPGITGQFDMVKAGPNQLIVIGSDEEGTKVWPITVDRIKVSPRSVAVQGRVVDQKDEPIANANIELGPNRYALDCWHEDPTVKDAWDRRPRTVGSPVMGYRAISEGNPIAQTDGQGQYRFESVKCGEYVMTVEADGFAPQFRHIKVDSTEPQDFRLPAGRKVSSRVLDNQGEPVAGACVVLNNWHTHTDADGYFHWSVEAPLPEQVTTRVDKRYSAEIPGSTAMKYGTEKSTVPLSQIEQQPFVLHE